MVAGRTAQLFEVHPDHRNRTERFYDWVDQETRVVLKLVSLIESGHSSMSGSDCRLSLPPYFEEPPGYHERLSTSKPPGQG